MPICSSSPFPMSLFLFESYSHSAKFFFRSSITEVCLVFSAGCKNFSKSFKASNKKKHLLDASNVEMFKNAYLFTHKKSPSLEFFGMHNELKTSSDYWDLWIELLARCWQTRSFPRKRLLISYPGTFWPLISHDEWISTCFEFIAKSDRTQQSSNSTSWETIIFYALKISFQRIRTADTLLKISVNVNPCKARNFSGTGESKHR